jgi:hypothetical protein
MRLVGRDEQVGRVVAPMSAAMVVITHNEVVDSRPRPSQRPKASQDGRERNPFEH